jgi:hypothetical protein
MVLKGFKGFILLMLQIVILDLEWYPWHDVTPVWKPFEKAVDWHTYVQGCGQVCYVFACHFLVMPLSKAHQGEWCLLTNVGLAGHVIVHPCR